MANGMIIPNTPNYSEVEYGTPANNNSLKAIRRGSTVTVAFYNVTASFVKSITLAEQFRFSDSLLGHLDQMFGTTDGRPTNIRLTSSGQFSNIWQTNNGSVTDLSGNETLFGSITYNV